MNSEVTSQACHLTYDPFVLACVDTEHSGMGGAKANVEIPQTYHLTGRYPAVPIN